MSDNTYILPITQWYKGIYNEGENGGITLAQADARYVRNGGNATLNSISTGSIDSSSYSLSGITINLSAITDVTPGTATGSKALILDSSKNISELNSLSSSYLSTKNTDATLITSATNGSLYGLHLHSVLASNNGVYAGSSIAFNNASSDTVPLAAVFLDKIGSGNGQLVFSTRNGSGCDERARLSSTGLSLNAGGNVLRNTEIGYLTSNTVGSAIASKALVLDSTKSASGLNSLSFNSPSSTSIQITGNNIYEAFAINNGTCNFSMFNSSTTMNIRTTSAHPLLLGTSGAVQFQIAANGNISNSGTAPSYSVDFRGCTRSEGILASVSTASTAAPSGNVWAYNSGMTVGSRQSHFQFGRTTTDSDFAHYRIESVYNAAADKLNNHMVLRLVSSAGGFSMNGWGDVRVTGRNGGSAQQTTIAALEVVGYENASVGAGYGYFNSGQASIPGGTVPISLQTSSNIWCSGTIYVTSDERLKKNIRKLNDEECEKILELDGVEFDWKEDSVRDYKNYGFIAQEVMKVLPELVGVVPNEKLDNKLQLVLSLEKFIPYIVGVLKKQQAAIKKLERRVGDR